MAYEPPQAILEKYADLLVNFALGAGEGIAPGDVVYVKAPEVAKPLYTAIIRAITEAGGHYISDYLPDEGLEHYPKRDFLLSANEEQISFFPETYYETLVESVDHYLPIIGDVDKQAMSPVDPKTLMRRNETTNKLRRMLMQKINAGQLTRTVGLYGTTALADEVGLSEEAYWQEIITGCYLDTDDPKQEWKQIIAKNTKTRDWLNDFAIDTLHIKSENTDLTVAVGEKRDWVIATGDNIPSYEIFTSPDWRGTSGVFYANQPLYRYGNIITDITLEFEDGLVTTASASQNEDVLKEMIATEGANKVGEFSLTDKRLSRIGHFMAETLYDENMGATDGNTHIALGMAYKEAYSGDKTGLDEDDWEELGFNDSVVHTDIISTEPRTVTATLKDGSERVIYKDGQFQIENF